MQRFVCVRCSTSAANEPHKIRNASELFAFALQRVICGDAQKVATETCLDKNGVSVQDIPAMKGATVQVLDLVQCRTNPAPRGARKLSMSSLDVKPFWGVLDPDRPHRVAQHRITGDSEIVLCPHADLLILDRSKTGCLGVARSILLAGCRARQQHADGK